MKPEIILIAAVAKNGVIGVRNTLPWRLKADLAHFKATTTGHPVLMGRKTWESLGRPLPGRRNLVVTRRNHYEAEGAEIFASPEEALRALTDADRVFVIGGAELYRQMIGCADALMLTEVHAEVAGDAFFPPVDPAEFVEVSREAHAADSGNDHAFDFVELRRR